MLRRDFLRRLVAAASGGSAAAALGLTLPSALRAEAGVGVDGARRPTALSATPSLGIQLYTLRTLLERDPERTLSALAEIGFEEVELAGLHGRSAGEFRGMLDRAGLRAPAGHVSLDPPPASGPWEAWERSLEEAVTLGHRWVVVAWIDERERTIDGYRRVAERFNAAGRAAREVGLRFAYHNHEFEFDPLDGRVVPYNLLLEETEAELVEMELDLFWVIHGGGDPLAYFEREPGRFPLVHVKDRSAEGEMVDVGEGTIDFRTIFDRAELAGIQHAFLEHDDPESPLDFARASLAFTRELLR